MEPVIRYLLNIPQEPQMDFDSAIEVATEVAKRGGDNRTDMATILAAQYEDMQPGENRQAPGSMTVFAYEVLLPGAIEQADDVVLVVPVPVDVEVGTDQGIPEPVHEVPLALSTFDVGAGAEDGADGGPEVDGVHTPAKRGPGRPRKER